MIIVDNWYDDPYGVRDLALSKFKTENNIPGDRKRDNGFEIYPGRRTKACLKNLIENRDKMERSLGRSIDTTKWAFTLSVDKEVSFDLLEFDLTNMEMKIKGTDIYLNPFIPMSNGCFQYCDENSTMWIHSDQLNSFAAVVYLTPDPPEGTGTGFFKHKETGKYYQTDKEQLFTPEQASNFDEWEMLEYCENVFNRCVIFNAKHFHSATKYFGTTPENSRLTQVFFFDLL